MLGGGDGVRGGGVDDQAPVLGGRLQVHIVDPDPGPAHHLQPPLGRLEHLPRHLRPAPHDQRVHVRDLRAQLLGRQVEQALHPPVAAQDVQPRLSQLLGDQDRRPVRRAGPAGLGAAPRFGRRRRRRLRLRRFGGFESIGNDRRAAGVAATRAGELQGDRRGGGGGGGGGEGEELRLRLMGSRRRRD